MLSSLHLWPKIRARLWNGPLGPHLDPFVEELTSEGYTHLGIRCYLQAADRFTGWLQRRRIPASGIQESIVNRFIGGLRRTARPGRPNGRPPMVAAGVRRLAQFLWTHHVAERQVAVDSSETEQWLREFDQHLDCVQGVGAGVRRTYLAYARRLLQQRFGDGVPDFSALTAADIATFVQEQAKLLKPSGSRAPVTAVRAMLRYLILSGKVHAGLDGAVPTIRQWTLTSLPHYLTTDQFQSVLASCTGLQLEHRRDRAILLLLGRLGLRAGEVAALRLQDIRWSESQILIRAGKTARERLLPLTNEVGQALADYLCCRGASPKQSCVFLRVSPRHRPLRVGGISSLVTRALRRAGIQTPYWGAHLLRHTAATHMVRQGVPFKQVADVLGHACLTTTTVYAKLDVQALAAVALPWPGGVS